MSDDEDNHSHYSKVDDDDEIDEGSVERERDRWKGISIKEEPQDGDDNNEHSNNNNNNNNRNQQAPIKREDDDNRQRGERRRDTLERNERTRDNRGERRDYVRESYREREAKEREIRETEIQRYRPVRDEEGEENGNENEERGSRGFRNDRDDDRNRQRGEGMFEGRMRGGRFEFREGAPNRERNENVRPRMEPVVLSEEARKRAEDIEKKVQDATEKERPAGVYIPPFRLKAMMKDVQDKSSEQYQRLSWDALKKSITGLINKISASNIQNIILQLFGENVVRGRGLLARAIMRAQHASPAFSNTYASLLAVVNTKMPEVGELVVKRLLEQFKRAFRRNDKAVLVSTSKFLAHLSNQMVVGVVIPLEVVTLLLDKPTDSSVEVAVEFIKECGANLQEQSPQATNSIFDRFRGILHEGEIDQRVQYMIEELFAIRRSNFSEFPAIPKELDLVQEEDQITHDHLELSTTYDVEDTLNYFKPDPDFVEHEKKYEEIKLEILGEGGDENDEDGEKNADESDDEDEDEEEGDEETETPMPDASASTVTITDQTETNLVNLRRTIYLTIMSSLDFEECAHKMMKIKLLPGQEMELCAMVIECCSQERTYLRFYGLLGQRFCQLNRIHQQNFDTCFAKQYSTIHRLETNKLRNVAKFFAHLLHSDAISWQCLGYIHLNQEETTSSSRIFIKILLQEISEFLGLSKLVDRFHDPVLASNFEGLFPKDSPRNARFAINFFISIGLGGLTEDLRKWLETAPKRAQELQKQQELQAKKESSSSDSDSDSSDSSDDTDDSDSSDSDSSESDSSSSSSPDKNSGKRDRRSFEREREAEKGRKEREKEKEKEKERGKEREPERNRNGDRGRDRERESQRENPRDRERNDREKGREREREQERPRGDRNTDRNVDREKDREKEKEKERERERVQREKEKEKEKDREKEREREPERSDRNDRERDSKRSRR